MQNLEDNEIISRALEVSRRELMKYDHNINPAHKFDHTQRVFNICTEILKYHEEADSLVVLVAAAFHDIGRIKKDGDHAVWSREIMAEYFKSDSLLSRMHESREKKILSIIENHSKKDGESELDKMIEFQIVVDADRIDSFGPVGIIRSSLDARFQKDAKVQLNHIKEKCDVNNFVLRSKGGQEVGLRYKKYLYAFGVDYRQQLAIGEDNIFLKKSI